MWIKGSENKGKIPSIEDGNPRTLNATILVRIEIQALPYDYVSVRTLPYVLPQMLLPCLQKPLLSHNVSPTR